MSSVDDSASLALHYDAVVERIASRNHVREKTARRWFAEMVRFLDLCAAADEPLAPSKKVDKAWHEFLLFTRSYGEFCEWRYQCFLHHDPSEDVDSDAYQRTYRRYSDRYGRPDATVWPIGDWLGGGGCAAGGGCSGDGCSGGGCSGGGCSGGG